MSRTSVPSRLGLAALPALRSTQATLPNYDPATVSVGVVHIGPGAFHRAHQAHYLDRVLGRDPRWGICAVSLRSRATVDALRAQNGLYVLAERDAVTRLRIVGAIRESCMAHDGLFAERLASPGTRLVTLSITEKGYCLGADGRLDFHHPDIVADCAAPRRPSSAIGWLLHGLSLRRAARAGGLTVVSCDNLSGNGSALREAVIALTHRVEPALAGWISDEVTFPNTMIDSITPAADAALSALIQQKLNIVDLCPVQREAFTAWVIDAGAASCLAPLGDAGAIFTTDVKAHERAKLKLLNGAHSTLAYLGLARGYETVAAAMRDNNLARFIESMMREEIVPTLSVSRELDVDAYCSTLLERFRNPALEHKLSQIAWDGSQKLPVRILGTIADNVRAGRPIARLCTGVAAWMRFVRRSARSGGALTDPLATALLQIGSELSDDAAPDVAAFLRLNGVFSELASNARLRAALVRGYEEAIGWERRAEDAPGTGTRD